MPRNPPPEASLPSLCLRFASGVLFTLLLVLAPLNYGSTRSGGPEMIVAGCALATTLWLLSLAVSRTTPIVPRAALIGSALVCLAALPWLTGLAEPTSILRFTAMHFARIAHRWPHSIVWINPANGLFLTVALAVSILPLIDLARSGLWSLVFSGALVGTAAIVAGLALAQSYTHAPGILWRADPQLSTHFAGTFYHHTSAGAYLNTAWPLAVALTAIATGRSEIDWVRSTLLGLCALTAILIISAHGSHISRFPQVAALLVLPFLVRALKIRWRSAGMIGIGATVAVLAIVSITGRSRDIAERWQLFSRDTRAAVAGPAPAPETWSAVMRSDLFVPSGNSAGPFGDRAEGWRTAARAMMERPLTGHGPANWIGAASHHSADPFVRTFFQFLQFTHQDLLQSVVEWGIVGAVGWWLLLLGGVGSVVRAQTWQSERHRVLGIAAACSLAAVLLQAQVDFPLQIPAIAFNAIVLAALGWAAVGQTGSQVPDRISSRQLNP